jgi:hypothetical protein
MEIYVSGQNQEVIDSLIAQAQELGVEAQVVGKVEGTDGKKQVTIEGPHGTFTYN